MLDAVHTEGQVLMAHVKQIVLHLDGYMTVDIMRVYVSLKPDGEVCLKVPMPQDFKDCLMRMAQAAADKHEQDMRAQILADAAKDDREAFLPLPSTGLKVDVTCGCGKGYGE